MGKILPIAAMTAIIIGLASIVVKLIGPIFNIHLLP